MIENGEITFKTHLPIRLEKILKISPYFSPQKLNKHNLRIRINKCPDQIFKQIQEMINVSFEEIATRKDENQARINSTELYNYLTTFFRYTKVPKIQPPLTSEVKFWHDNGIDLKRAIIIPCLQSDGTISRRKVRELCEPKFYGNSRSLHNYFSDAMYFEYSILPSSYYKFDASSNTFCTLYSQKSAHKVVNEVMSLAGNTKTSPANGQTVDEYLKEPQPHLKYLLNAHDIEQQIALRIWMSTEGSVGIAKNKDWIIPTLRIGCAHPVLATQLINIAKQQNITFTKSNSKKNWSGISGGSNASIKASIAFIKFGGFIPAVKINSRSPYHEGIDKDKLILGILEFKKREKENDQFKKLPLKAVHYAINKIIENEEYKNREYYITYFS